MMMNLFLPSWLLCEIVVKVSSSFGRGAGLLWLLCFSLYFSHGFYTSHTPSISCYEFVSVLNWTPNINPCFCLCVLCASVSVSCVLLPRNCRRRRAWCYGLNRWLWLVMAGSEVLFGIRNRIWTLCRRPGRSRTTLKQYFWMTPQANGPMCKDFGQSFSEEINFEGQRLKNLYNIMFKQFDLSLCHLFVTHQ